MSKVLPEIDDRLADWLRKQHVFFVSTAPLADSGHINTSPKGGDAFRILGPLEVAYLDYTGSGAETVAHVRENGRILLMFCAFEGPPNIVRLHGEGEIVQPGDPGWATVSAQFPNTPGVRAIIKVQVKRVSSSCGFSVPNMDFKSDRDALIKWTEAKGPDGLRDYRAQKNVKSIDGLPAFSD